VWLSPQGQLVAMTRRATASEAWKKVMAKRKVGRG
jgi:hypothetical protein